MSFSPTDAQKRIIRSLNQLEIEGCVSASDTGQPCPPRIRLDCGVPLVLLKAWVDLSDTAFDEAIAPLRRRELVKERELPA